MRLERLIVENFKSLRSLNLELNPNLSIIVGNNDVGKSTILEAINLALCGQIHGKNILYEITPYIFNKDAVASYVEAIKEGKYAQPPRLLIEAYFGKDEELAGIRGINNSLGENTAGVRLIIEFNDEYRSEYTEYLKKTNGNVGMLPVEYYSARWLSFANNAVTAKSIPIRSTIIDTHAIKTASGTDKYIANIIDSVLSQQQRVALSISYRKMRHEFSNAEDVVAINSFLKGKQGEISEKEFSISVDTSSRSTWESSLAPYLDEIPFSSAGKGEQSSVKMRLAMQASSDCHVLLIEEPENHLAYANMHRLISKISESSAGKQVIIATHSSFVLNKLGVEKVILFSRTSHMKLDRLEKETFEYFMKLPGHDTLRLILSRKAVLVEGPSDELIVQRAFLDKYKKPPLEAGVDIISVKSLAFKRFLDIAKTLSIQASVVTDNDGDVNKLEQRYAGYLEYICYDRDIKARTLEDQLLKANSLRTLNEILEKDFSDAGDLVAYMKANKTDVALKIFSSQKSILYPEYILNAIKE